ncbi:MAG: hypothetical protein HZA01_14275 [Nitrospinae bacterium]|nr:hypothetical protein [Nitrospinota bacterium]
MPSNSITWPANACGSLNGTNVPRSSASISSAYQYGVEMIAFPAPRV